MTAIVIRFPKKFHPVCVQPTEDGWFVSWRSCGWIHSTRAAALTDARAIAAAHGAPVIEHGGKEAS